MASLSGCRQLAEQEVLAVAVAAAAVRVADVRRFNVRFTSTESENLELEQREAPVISEGPASQANV